MMNLTRLFGFAADPDLGRPLAHGRTTRAAKAGGSGDHEAGSNRDEAWRGRRGTVCVRRDPRAWSNGLYTTVRWARAHDDAGRHERERKRGREARRTVVIAGAEDGDQALRRRVVLVEQTCARGATAGPGLHAARARVLGRGAELAGERAEGGAKRNQDESSEDKDANESDGSVTRQVGAREMCKAPGAHVAVLATAPWRGKALPAPMHQRRAIAPVSRKLGRATPRSKVPGRSTRASSTSRVWSVDALHAAPETAKETRRKKRTEWEWMAFMHPYRREQAPVA